MSPYYLQTKSHLEAQHTENFSEPALSFPALLSKTLYVCPDFSCTYMEENPEPRFCHTSRAALSVEEAHSSTLHLNVCS